MWGDYINDMKETHWRSDKPCNVIGMEIGLVQEMEGTIDNDRNTGIKSNKGNAIIGSMYKSNSNNLKEDSLRFQNTVVYNVPKERILPK